jgi:phospholipase/carboxylesterase
MSGELAGHVHRFEAGTDDEAPVLLLLHGTGADEHDLIRLGEHLDPGAPLLSPRGRVSEQGMNRWFRRLAEGVFDTDDVVRRADELAGFVDAARSAHDLGDRPVVAVGFSNGANIAAALLLLHPGVLRGALLFSAMLPLRPERLPDLADTAVLMSAGRVDPMAPPASAEELAALLTEAGASVELRWHDTGHGIDLDQVAAARDWLAKLRAATGSPDLP